VLRRRHEGLSSLDGFRFGLGVWLAALAVAALLGAGAVAAWWWCGGAGDH
jgi:hypothetical protein